MIPELVWQIDPGAALGSNESSHDPTLELRMGFFREQWEIAGPGWLHLICRRIGPSPSAAASLAAGPADVRKPVADGLKAPLPPVTVACRAPVSGPRAGVIDGNSCWCTALLHDLDPRVPETWRLTWVLTGVLLLRAERDGSATTVDGDLLRRAAGLTLETGREMGLVPEADPSLDLLAQEMWCDDVLTVPPGFGCVSGPAAAPRSERSG